MIKTFYSLHLYHLHSILPKLLNSSGYELRPQPRDSGGGVTGEELHLGPGLCSVVPGKVHVTLHEVNEIKNTLQLLWNNRFVGRLRSI